MIFNKQFWYSIFIAFLITSAFTITTHAMRQSNEEESGQYCIECTFPEFELSLKNCMLNVRIFMHANGPRVFSKDLVPLTKENASSNQKDFLISFCIVSLLPDLYNFLSRTKLHKQYCPIVAAIIEQSPIEIAYSQRVNRYLSEWFDKNIFIFKNNFFIIQNTQIKPLQDITSILEKQKKIEAAEYEEESHRRARR